MVRLWSLHPAYLDVKGLVAVWREGLLARAVLLGNTRGYHSHPQLLRFRAAPDPVAALDVFLNAIWEEAECRGYHFDRSKISSVQLVEKLTVTHAQVDYERKHLLGKLRVRDPQRAAQLEGVELPNLNPLFRMIEGPIEAWEKV